MDNEVIANIKTLGIDMINGALSGHSGIVLGAAPIIYTLYKNHLNVNTNDSKWLNRDRFIMSSGHGSALLYATLFMAGYNLSIDDLKLFRRINSKTPGHPEYGITPGVDMSTGPLGQGFASAIGMAIAEKRLENLYVIPSKKKFEPAKHLFNYKIYVLCGDGDIMEGITTEAASLAGTLKLDNLIVLYDSNNVSLDGKTSLTFNEDVCTKFKSLGWDTLYVKNGNNIKNIDLALNKAKNNKRPTLIEIKTVIGDGSVLAGTNEIHGKVLDKNDIKQLKDNLNIPNEPFYVNESAKNNFISNIYTRSSKKYEQWAINYKMYVNEILKGDNSSLSYLFNDSYNYDLSLLDWNFATKEATRDSNHKVMQKINELVPNFLGGSADLSSSTKTYIRDEQSLSFNNYLGKNIYFGVREHAMGAILNGLALSGFKPYGSTFLAFSDYLKPSIRMSALINLPVTYIFTHDSITVGQDGPTHQPIEQLNSLRDIPNNIVFRPADAKEVVGCWQYILNNKRVCSLILSRNEMPLLSETNISDVLKGAYIVRHEENVLNGIIIATGSEVSTAINLANELKRNNNLDLRVISMPSIEIFLTQSKEYTERIIPSGFKVITLEASTSMAWHRFVYNEKYIISIDQFGASGTKDEVLRYCNFDYQNILQRIKNLF